MKRLRSASTLCGCVAMASTAAAQSPPPTAPPPVVASPPVAPPPPAPDAVDPGPTTIRNGFSAKLGAGPTYRGIHDHDVWGARVAAAFGAQFKDWGAVHGELAYGIGKTDGGLLTESISVGPTWEFLISRIRLGLGFQYTHIWIQRVTFDDSLSGGGMGFNAGLGVDLIQGERFNLNLSFDGRYSWLDERLGYGGVGVLIGTRFKTP